MHRHTYCIVRSHWTGCDRSTFFRNSLSNYKSALIHLALKSWCLTPCLYCGWPCKCPCESPCSKPTLSSFQGCMCKDSWLEYHQGQATRTRPIPTSRSSQLLQTNPRPTLSPSPTIPYLCKVRVPCSCPGTSLPCWWNPSWRSMWLPQPTLPVPWAPPWVPSPLAPL